MEKVETPFRTLLFYCCVFLLTRSLITALSNLSAGFIAIGHSSGLVTIMDILTGSILSRAEAVQPSCIQGEDRGLLDAATEVLSWNEQ